MIEVLYGIIGYSKSCPLFRGNYQSGLVRYCLYISNLLITLNPYTKPDYLPFKFLLPKLEPDPNPFNKPGLARLYYKKLN